MDYNKTIAIVVHLLPCRLHWSSSILVNEIRSIISTTANEPSILPTSSESTIPTWLSKKPRNTGHVRHVIWWGWTSRLQRPSENKKHTWNQTVKCILFHGDSLYLSCNCYESYLICLEKTCPRLKGPSSRRATLREHYLQNLANCLHEVQKVGSSRMVTRLTGITVLPWQGHPSSWANLSKNKHFGSSCRVNSVKTRIWRFR